MKKLLLFVVLIGLNMSLFSQSWMQFTSSDLEISFPETIVKHGSDWYLGVPGGVFKLANGSDTWILVNNGLYSSLGDLRVEGLFSSGSNLLAVNRWRGVVYSNNGGTLWNASSGISSSYYVSSKIVEINSRLLIVVKDYDSSNGWIYYSDNNGITWNLGADVPGINNEPNIFSDGTNAYITHTNLSDTDEFLAQTTNGETIDALSFSASFPGTGRTIESILVSGNYLMVIGEENLFRYDMVGSGGWTNIGSSSYWPNGILFVSMCENGAGTLFGSVLEGDMSLGFYSSTDQGDSWDMLGAATTRGVPFATSVAAVGNEVMASFIDDGIHYSSDISTLDMTLKNSGLLGSDFDELFISGGNLLTSLFISGAYGSLDGGVNWSKWNTGFPTGVAMQRIYGFQIDGTDLYVNYSNNPDDDPDPQDVYKSSDNGLSWSIVSYPASLDNVKIVGKSGSILFVVALDGSSRRYFKTSNGGVDWTEITTIPINYTPMVVSGDGTDVFMAGVDDSNIIAVYKSEDNGDSWTSAMIGINTGDLDAISEDEDILLITPLNKAFIKVRYTNWNYKLLKWDGIQWQSVTANNLSNQDFKSMDYDDGVLFVSPWNDIVHFSYDDGASFNTASGLPDGLNANNYAFDSGIAYITTDRGIWQLTIPTTLDKAVIQNDIFLTPNPASDIVYLNANANHVKIYSITGQLIKNMEISSNYFSVSDLSTGMYIVEFEVANNEIILKLIKD